ncbi:hypothetical protein ES332_D08G177300v1 [Gossypium tomentosum]|uniref:C2H2-type domain-containing protein n=2 Tax=Gossypium tomentosum TaxID=34277 RepID=A0A5D2JVD2_GOSTO|nr:hypothetical protein ES332_D08G177300v1 [Gossypium tomentosum]TYH58772.1 hypothetical protein ES332_D08G177300v1 [Gossypium tomentosum]
MEKVKCKQLCLKSFANGETQLRSNMVNLPIPPNVEQESASPSYSSSSSEEKGQFYGLRENPKRSIRFVDPEFVDADSVVVQSKESETESSKYPTQKRSRRTWDEPEPASSLSDTTTEEDIAFCLMMLSRGQRKSKVAQHDDIDDEEEETDESAEFNRTTRGKYRCETCNKVFNSYQALGGHRASHKKIKAFETELAPENVGTTCSMTEKKTHECPVCFKVFSSGQALGGHKRSHVAAATAQTYVKSSNKLVVNFIDLNLPAPVDDDDDDDGFLMLK